MTLSAADGGGRPRASSATPRGAARKEKILQSAVRLFSEHGYDGVGVNDIAAGAGVTGTAIYRHFTGKEAILESLFDHLNSRLVDGVAQARERASAPKRLLAEFVTFHVRLALDERDLIRIYLEAAERLPPGVRRRARQVQRDYVRQWAAVLSTLRPELSERACQAEVHAAIGLINSVGFYDTHGLERSYLERTLNDMAMRALTGRRGAR